MAGYNAASRLQELMERAGTALRAAVLLAFSCKKRIRSICGQKKE